MATKNKVTLGYWNMKGRGEAIRLLMTILKIDFEEVRYGKIPPEQGGPDWLNKDKQALGFDFPNIPYLIDGQTKLTESMAILKYVCKIGNRLDMIGKTIDDQIQLDVILGVLQDAQADLYQTGFASNKSEEDLKQLFANPKNKFMIKMSEINTYLKGKKFIVGYMTYVDVYFFVIQDFLNALTTKLLGVSILDNFVNIKNCYTNMKGLPEIQSYESNTNFSSLSFLPPYVKFQI